MCTSAALWRAFDKAVRREPPAVAEDAGPMQIQLWEVRCPDSPGLCERARHALASSANC
jgi:hypothetical protein